MLNSADYPALEALAQIAQTGAFDRAAAALGVTTGAISQRISGLEDRLGTILLRRTPQITLTATGARLVRHFNEVRALETGLSDILGPPDTPATLRIAVNADSLAAWALPAFASVDHLLFDFEIDDQDHSDRWLRDGAVAAAITSHATAVRGCDVTPLGALAYDVVASPDFAARHFPKGVTADALRNAPALIFNRKDRLQHDWAARLCGPTPQLTAHYLPSTADITQALRLGMGWGLNPSTLFHDDLSAGRLIKLDPEPLMVPLYWQVARLSASALAPLTQALKTEAQGRLRHEDARSAKRKTNVKMQLPLTDWVKFSRHYLRGGIR